MKVETASISDISAIASVIAQLGLSVEPTTLRRFFFESPVSGWSPAVRGGFVVRDDDGQVVGYSGLSPCTVMLDGKGYPAYQMGVLGILPHYGGAMFEIMDRVSDLAKDSLVYANTANLKSGKLWTGYAGFEFGPQPCGCCQYEIIPLGFLTSFRPYRQSVFPQDKIEQLCQEGLLKSDHLHTSREYERIKWMYDGQMGRCRFSWIFDCDGNRINGYAVLGLNPARQKPIRRFEIMDFVAANDSPIIVKRLLRKIKWFAALHGGVLLEYIGSKNILRRRRAIPSNPFIWKTAIPELQTALQNAPDSFFGPYDGDRSLG